MSYRNFPKLPDAVCVPARSTWALVKAARRGSSRRRSTLRERERERGVAASPEGREGGSLGTSRVSPSRRRQESQLATLESGRALKY